MEKKTECQIVQDLLLGYVDDVLNVESKKLVEKHLSECEICQNKLKEINADIKENENNEKKQIDYLKKIRRKNRRKAVIIALGIILFICFIMYLHNFIIYNNLLHNSKESLASSNLYIESRNKISTDKMSIEKIYYKDGKYKEVSEILTDGGAETISTTYCTVNSDERIRFLEAPKKVIIEKNEFYKIANTEENLKAVPLFARDYRMIMRLVAPIIMKIDKEEIFDPTMLIQVTEGSAEESTEPLNIRKCYRFRNRFDEEIKWQIWIDKETGLPLKETDKDSRSTFFQGTEIVKDTFDNTVELRYKFDTVTDEDVEIPDFTGYTVEEHTF